MSDFNRAMSQMLAVFTKDLGGKVTVQEIEGMPRLGFLAIPGTEYSDRIYAEFYPRKETAAVMKATEYLKKIVANRRNPPASASSGFSLSEFTSAMSEVLKIFTEDLGGHVSLMELGSNLRLSLLARSGVEHSDLLYKEFYPKRETSELKKAITVLQGIAQRRGAGGAGMGGGATYGSVPLNLTPKRREPHTIYTSYSKPVTPAQDVSRFYSPAKPLVKKAVLDTMIDPSPVRVSASPAPARSVETSSTLMVFDYVSFTMKPVGSFI